METMMKFETISISLLASLALCSCSEPVDQQQQGVTVNTSSVGKQPAPIEQPAVADVSRPPLATSAAQILSDHFASSDKSSNSSKLHDLFLKDDRDGSWAYQGETLLNQRLASLASSTSVEISQVECRSTMCEVLATASNPITVGSDIDRWQDAVYGSRSQLEQAGLAVESIAFTHNANGQVVIVTHLTRRKGLAHGGVSNKIFNPTPLGGTG